jgi:hypothetical protein
MKYINVCTLSLTYAQSVFDNRNSFALHPSSSILIEQLAECHLSQLSFQYNTAI